MTGLDYDLLQDFINREVIGPFYDKRIKSLQLLTLVRGRGALLRRKNPYLLRAKDIRTAGDFVKHALDAFLFSQEEAIFGNLLENFAIHICGQVFGGVKAPPKTYPSVDLLFERDAVYYIVGIKSGIVWGNNDQIKAMARNFKLIKTRLISEGETRPIQAVNGCMYGADANPFKENREDPDLSYYKYCGDRFWELISGDKDLYLRLIEPLGQEARKRSPELADLYVQRINEMTAELVTEFMTDGQIDWVKIIRFVSSSNSPLANESVGI